MTRIRSIFRWVLRSEPTAKGDSTAKLPSEKCTKRSSDSLQLTNLEIESELLYLDSKLQEGMALLNQLGSTDRLDITIFKNHFEKMCRTWLESRCAWKSTIPLEWTLILDHQKGPILHVEIDPAAPVADLISPCVPAFFHRLLTERGFSPQHISMRISFPEGTFPILHSCVSACAPDLHSFERMWNGLFLTSYPNQKIDIPNQVFFNLVFINQNSCIS